MHVVAVNRTIRVLLALFLVVPSVSAWANTKDRAREILDTSGVHGGLIVHIGCGDGRLTAALRWNASYVVHGLDESEENIERARAHIRSLGIYGKVSVERWAEDRLPYVDNAANLLVSEDLGKISTQEVMRVLAPHGVACVRRGDRWITIVKPRPNDTDEWTHYLYDASGNPVAHDSRVGPPRYLQWTAGPRYTRSHEHIPSIYSVVSTGGRVFYIADQTPVASIRQTPGWNLVARDAHNGILLWKQPITTWFPHIVNWGATPRQLQRKLVAVGNRVYVTLGLHSPLSAVDAVTGETLKVYQQTDGTEEIVCHRGILLLAVRSVTKERVAELAKWAELVQQDKSPVFSRDSAEPLVNRLKRIESRGEKRILALDAASGHVLWKKTGDDVAGLRSLSLCAEGERVFYQRGREVSCLDLKSGEKLWSASSAPLRVVHDGNVVCADGKAVTVLSAETGKARWTKEASLVDVRDAFVANGSLWIGGFKPIEGKRSPAWGPYFVTQRDLATGEMLMHVEPENPGHHHRCYSNKATDRFILGGRRGTEFIDLNSGDVQWNSFARGVCKYGIMPCNGLLYAPPHACACYVGAKLTGFNALSAARETTADDETPRLDKGPAYNDLQPTVSSLQSSSWPTYRHDGKRSGGTPNPVPAVLQRKWQADVGGKISAPTVAAGKVFVASVDEHRVSALDADSGEIVWRFTAGARVDSPPTLHAGRAVFGCRDGHVYSVRTADGELAWRLRAAREHRRVAAYGQLESASPVHGSVLIRDGVAYCTAGRLSYLDGGIDLCRLEPTTGRLLSRTEVYTPDPVTDKQPPQSAPATMPGARSDILSCDDQHVYLRDMVFDADGGRQPEGSDHLFTLTDFLDDTWPHRSYWIFGKRISISTGCSGRDKNLLYGRLLVFDDSMVYGYGRRSVHWSNHLEDGPYRVFSRKPSETGTEWEKTVPIHVRAMLRAGNTLFVAGPPAGVLEKTGGSGETALLLALAASDGTELGQHLLDASPVFDGMAAANGRLYVSLENDKLLCLAGKE